MSTHKAAGKAKQHTSPAGKRLGTKVGAMEMINSGQILVRQNGTKIHAGKNVKVGRDHTLYAVASGVVQFSTKMGKKLVNVVTK